MKATETKPTDRAFTLEVNEQELQFLARGLRHDSTNHDENERLYGELSDFMETVRVKQLR